MAEAQDERLDPAPPSLPKIHATFFMISLVTIGGGYAIVPVIERRLARRGWMDHERFMTLFSMAQACPGPMAMNTAFLVGAELRGWAGAAAAWLGVLLPPFATVVAVSIAYAELSGIKAVADFLNGAYGAAVGLVAALLIKLFASGKWRLGFLIPAAAACAALILWGQLAFPIIAGGMLLSYLLRKL
jgi:chromate transporter